MLAFYIAACKIWKKVNKTFELSSSTKEAEIKGTRHMEEVNESIKQIERRKSDKFRS